MVDSSLLRYIIDTHFKNIRIDFSVAEQEHIIFCEKIEHAEYIKKVFSILVNDIKLKQHGINLSFNKLYDCIDWCYQNIDGSWLLPIGINVSRKTRLTDETQTFFIFFFEKSKDILHFQLVWE